MSKTRFFSGTVFRSLLFSEAKLTKPSRHFSQFASESKPYKPSLFLRSLEIACSVTGAGMALGTLWMLKKYGLQNRQNKITGSYINLSEDNHSGLIVSSEEFEYVKEKNKGELDGNYVRHKKDGKLYLKKGAQSKHMLVAEFLISDFLNMVREEQPKCLILQEKQADGSAEFFTLSEIHDNTMDLEDFIKLTNWRENLKKKPLVGFEIAIASDLMFSKEKDMKYANYLVTETADAYVVTAIDHEFSGDGFFAKQVFSYDIAEISKYIIDLYPANDFNRSEMAGDIRGIEFMEFVLKNQFMHKENIIQFYKMVSHVNMRNVQKLIDTIDKNNEVITKKQGREFENMMQSVQMGAKKFCDNIEFNEKNLRTAKI